MISFFRKIRKKMADDNKLLKQAFAVAKSGLPYDENYVSNLS